MEMAESCRKDRFVRFIRGKCPGMMKEDQRAVQELVCRAQKGDMAAKESICCFFKNYIFKLAHTAYKTLDFEDTAQDLWLCLLEELMKYDTKRGVPFPSYIMRRLKWRLIECCRCHEKKLAREKKAAGNVQGIQDEMQPVLQEQDLYQMFDRCPLTELQRNLLEMRMSGMTWSEIARERNVSRCGIYAHVRRIRKVFLSSEEFIETFAA